MSFTHYRSGVPKGIRTPVTAVKGQCPRPLDDGDTKFRLNRNLTVSHQHESKLITSTGALARLHSSDNLCGHCAMRIVR